MVAIPRDLLPLSLDLHEWDVFLSTELSSLPFADRDHKAVAIVDAGGTVVGCSTPCQLGNAEAVIHECLNYFDRWDSGCAVLTNDPFSGSAHIQDHWLVRPVSDEGEVLGFALVVVHLVDIGGQNFGNFYPRARDVWQEGVRTTPVRLVRDGGIDRDVMELVKLNSRAPILVEHDLRVMHQLSERMSTEAVETLRSDDRTDDLMASSSLVVESVIQRITSDLSPKQAVVHNCAGPDATIALHIRRDSDRLIFDFTGSSLQVEHGFINSTLATTRSAVAVAVAELADAVPNSGIFRSLSVEAAQGSVVNCDYPLATSWSPYQPARLIIEMIKDSLSESIPPDPRARKFEFRPPAVRIDGCRTGSCPF